MTFLVSAPGVAGQTKSIDSPVMRRVSLHASPLLVSLAVLACTPSATPAEVVPNITEESRGNTQSEPSQPAPAPASAPMSGRGVGVSVQSSRAPGPAYFALEDGPVVELATDGSSRVLEGRRFAASPINRFEVGRDGNVYVVTRFDGIMTVDATGLHTVLDIVPGPFAVASNGVMWAIDTKRMIRVDGDDIQEIEPPGKYVDDLVVDAGDRIWASVDNGLYRRDAQGWTKVQLYAGGPLSFGGWKLTTHPRFDGVYAECDRAISRVAADLAVTQIGRLEPRPSTSARNLHLAFSTASAGIVSRTDGRVFMLPFDGDELAEERFDAPGIRLDAAALDDRGRAWLATPSAVMVTDITGEQPPTTWERGAVPALSDRIVAMAVLGAGPELPTIKPVEASTVTLAILDAAPEEDNLVDALTAEGSQPVVRAHVELCRLEHDNLEAVSPCEGSPSRVSGTTGKDGRVSLKLGPGKYTAAIRTDDGWYRTLVDVSPSRSVEEVDLTYAGWWLSKPEGS